MSDADFDILVEELRVVAACWFNGAAFLKLEALIREAKRARHA